MFALPGETDVVITGCPNGIDLEIHRTGDEVAVTTAAGREHRTSFREWRESVTSFSDLVLAFYGAASPKRPDVDDRPGFDRFMTEWTRRRSLAASAT